MSIQRPACWIALALLGTLTPEAGAQRYQGRGARVQTRSRDRGTERGYVVRIRTFGNAGDPATGAAARPGGYAGKKTGQIAIKSVRGPQFSAVLTHNTEYAVGRGQLPPSKVRLALAPGMPVELNWETSEEVGGRVVSAIRIITVEIEGVITKTGRKKLVVQATPKVTVEEQPRTEIAVRGRRENTRTGRNETEKPRKPEKLILNTSEITNLTVNGEPAKYSALRPTMAFDALVTDGRPNLVLELHARTEKDKESENDPNGKNKDKPDRKKEKERPDGKG